MINNSLFIKSSSGMGDFLFYSIITILVCDRYENVYLYYDKVHFNYLNIVINKFIKCNDKKNIILLSDPIYNAENSVDKYIDYFTKIIEFYGPNKLGKDEENNNTYYIHDYNHNTYNIVNVYINILNIFNLKVDDLFSIKYFLSDEEEKENEIYYQKVVSSIGENYIAVFNQPINRYQDIFTIRNYENDFNPNNYKVLFFGDQFDKNKITINNILGEYKPLNLYHKIIQNAKSIHCIDSYPSHYFNLLLNNVYEKYKYINVEKNIYTRQIIGLNNNYINLDINSFKDINDSVLKIYNNFNIYYSLFFFRSGNFPIKYFNDNMCSLLACSGDKITINNNIYINPTNEIDKFYLTYFNRILQQNITCNKSGIYYNNGKNIYNFVDINLKENTVNNNYIENFINFSHEENYNIVNKNLISNYTNIVLVKFDTIYYIHCTPRVLDDNNNIIDTNIYQPPKNYLKVIEHLYNNQHIDYIFPYRNDLDKLNFIKNLK